MWISETVFVRKFNSLERGYRYETFYSNTSENVAANKTKQFCHSNVLTLSVTNYFSQVNFGIFTKFEPNRVPISHKIIFSRELQLTPEIWGVLYLIHHEHMVVNVYKIRQKKDKFYRKLGVHLIELSPRKTIFEKF